MELILEQFNQIRIERVRGKIFRVLASFVCSLFIVYFYFLNITIGETVARRHNVQKLGDISFEYQQLEEKYFGTINKLDLDYAHSLGFVDYSKSDYATRQTVVVRR